MLTPKNPWRRISGQDEDARLMLTINAAGSTDSEVTDVTVMPLMSLPRPAVITLTPPVRRRMALRKSSAETSLMTLMSRTAEFILASLCLGIIAQFEKISQDRAFQRGEVRRAAAARTRDVDGDVMRYLTILDDQHTVSQ